MTATGGGDPPHDREVVRDEQVAQAEPLCSSGEQLEDPRLHGDVERGDRLVEHHQLGSRASARAMATRWRWPPESSRAGGRARSVGQRDPVDQPARPCGASGAVAEPKLRSGSATISATVCRGSSEANGFWYTSCTRRAELAQLRGPRAPVTSAADVTVPAVGPAKRTTIRAVVVLPGAGLADQRDGGAARAR